MLSTSEAMDMLANPSKVAEKLRVRQQKRLASKLRSRAHAAVQMCSLLAAGN